MKIDISNGLYNWIETNKGDLSRDACLRVALGLPALKRFVGPVRLAAEKTDYKTLFPELFDLSIGGKCVLPYQRDDRGEVTNLRQLDRAVRACRARLGQRLAVEGSPRGQIVIRLA